MISSLKKAAIKRKIRSLRENNDRLGAAEKIHTVGVIVDVDTFPEWQDFLKLKKWPTIRKVEIVCFSAEKKEKPELDGLLFTHKDVSLTGVVKTAQLTEFAEKNHDLLVCYTNKENLVFNLLTVLSQARFKVGICLENEDFYDLIIKTKIEDIEGFFKELQKYLKILKMLDNE